MVSYGNKTPPSLEKYFVLTSFIFYNLKMKKEFNLINKHIVPTVESPSNIYSYPIYLKDMAWQINFVSEKDLEGIKIYYLDNFMQSKLFSSSN